MSDAARDIGIAEMAVRKPRRAAAPVAPPPPGGTSLAQILLILQATLAVVALCGVLWTTSGTIVQMKADTAANTAEIIKVERQAEIDRADQASSQATMNRQLSDILSSLSKIDAWVDDLRKEPRR